MERKISGIMSESLIEWSLNGYNQAPLLCTREDVDVLLIGHLITAGFISSLGDIQVLREKEHRWVIETSALCNPTGNAYHLIESLPVNNSDLRIHADALDNLCNLTMSGDHSAGLHYILISDQKKIVIGKDIGRHNALDKAIGLALRQELDLHQSVLCSSGRLSLEMFSKGAIAGIPILATRKQVGSLSVSYGEKLQIAVCRMGKDRHCYSAAWRVHGIEGTDESDAVKP